MSTSKILSDSKHSLWPECFEIRNQLQKEEQKTTNLWRVNNKLLNPSWAKDQIKCAVNIQIKTKENVNISYQNFDLKSNILNGHDERAFFFNSSLFYYTCANFSFHPSFLQPNLPPHSPSPHHRPVLRVTQTCFLTNPFLSWPPFPYSLFSWSCQSVPCIHDSVSVLFVIFCVHYITPSSEVISKLWVTEKVVVREKFHHYR